MPQPAFIDVLSECAQRLAAIGEQERSDCITVIAMMAHNPAAVLRIRGLLVQVASP